MPELSLTQQLLARYPADQQAPALEQARQIITEQLVRAKTPRQRARWQDTDPATLALKGLDAQRMRAALAKAFAEAR